MSSRVSVPAFRLLAEILGELTPAAAASVYASQFGGDGSPAAFVRFLLARVADASSAWALAGVASAGGHARPELVSANAAEVVQVWKPLP